MSQGPQSVPVTVTVTGHHTPGHPAWLPFTGAPVETFAAVGVLLALAGTVVASAARRTPPTSRSAS